ncbi:unnamed protein product [Clonostachys rhizophaga]|uniref:Uncharacterized protein n=1 Tax=Clonostachys rhizophaga TaxID=160324 RepID=A0A9N9YH55_9HYPO|nr:unnamed protein product [Clonostachys rhizophaga]
MANWKWRKMEDEDQLDFLAADREIPLKRASELQGKWASEWDHYYPGWRWDGDEMAIANPKFLLNLPSDNEKKVMGFQDNLACSLRHWGRYSLSAESEWDHYYHLGLDERA